MLVLSPMDQAMLGDAGRRVVFAGCKHGTSTERELGTLTWTQKSSMGARG